MSNTTKIILSFIISLFSFSFVIYNYWAFYIPSESMYPNYFEGDIVISKPLGLFDNEFEKGKSYSFKTTVNGKKVVHIKRLIATEGDIINFKSNAHNNTYSIYVNGEKINQERVDVKDIPEHQINGIYDYYGHLDFDFFYETINDSTYLVMYKHHKYLDDKFINQYLMSNIEFKLGENENFFIGDNRNQSADSRYYGVVLSENIIYGSRKRLVNKNFLTNSNLRFFNKPSN